LILNTFKTDNYVTNHFKKGVLLSLPTFLGAIDGFDGDPFSEKGKLLSRILKPDIFTVFRLRHQAFAKEALIPSIKLDRIISPKISITDIHFSFGDSTHVNTTIIPAKTVQRFNAMTILRENDTGKYYRQGGLEYYVGKNDAVAGGRNLMEVAMKQGQVFGIDVSIQCQLTISLKNSEEQVFSSKELREVKFRFETNHFTKGENVRWSIADVDDYLVSKIVDEFWKDLGAS